MVLRHKGFASIAVGIEPTGGKVGIDIVGLLAPAEYLFIHK